MVYVKRYILLIISILAVSLIGCKKTEIIIITEDTVQSTGFTSLPEGSTETETEPVTETGPGMTVPPETESEKVILAEAKGQVFHTYEYEMLGTIGDLNMRTHTMHFTYKDRVYDYEMQGPFPVTEVFPEKYRKMNFYFGSSHSSGHGTTCYVFEFPNYLCIEIASTQELEEDREKDPENNFLIFIGSEELDTNEAWNDVKELLTGAWYTEESTEN